MLDLFDAHPRLARRLPHVSLGDFPTPVRPLSKLGRAIGVENLYVKNDGVSAAPYGGNKIRKLEFLLADAQAQGAKETLTFGFAGSNHAAATAVWAARLGFHPVSLLLHQPNATYVRDNLLVQAAVGCEFVVTDHAVYATVLEIARRRKRSGKRPYIVAPGGSSRLGTVGYVNAAFELKKQIDEGVLPVPDRIYVPLGSMGTAAGLLLGLKAAGLPSEVISVRVVDPFLVNPQTLRNLFNLTRDYLRLRDQKFPDVRLPMGEIQIRHGQFGDGYGHFTPAGMDARSLAQEAEGLLIDGTYTAKTLAALMEDSRAGLLGGKNVLFWNTYNHAPLSPLTGGTDWHELPPDLHVYFEEEVQLLDR